jgi:chemotaxis protein MotB
MDEHDTQGLVGEAPQDELWLVSYVDLLTLLIGFFVLLLAASGVKAARFERIAAAISGASPPPLESLRGKVDELIAKSQLADRVRTREDAEGLGIEFKDVLLFDSGSAELRTQAGTIVRDVAGLLAELPARPVIVEGHTDEVPIHNERFRSNWELSAQRAINVLQALEGAGVARDRMSARGYADTRPLAAPGEASLDERRTQNRRVVIRVE